MSQMNSIFRYALWTNMKSTGLDRTVTTLENWFGLQDTL